MKELDTSILDPGIRRLVTWLRAKGYNTTDSGDGVSKAESIKDGDALGTPHVFIPVNPADGIRLSEQLAADLASIGVELDPSSGPSVEFSYCPTQGGGWLSLFHLSDAGLPAGL